MFTTCWWETHNGAANLPIKRQRGDAPIFAAMQSDKRPEAGDMEGRRVWLSIREAIKELQRTRPRGDEPTH